MFPRATVSLVKRAQTGVIKIYYLYQIFWQGGSAILVVSLGVTTPLMTTVTLSMGAYLAKVLYLSKTTPIITAGALRKEA